MTKTIRLAHALLLSLFAGAALAQGTAITEERVRETVSWLAADERMGRNTGSPELVAAGEWIAARFQAAGLAQVQEGSWTHGFPLPGHWLDSREVQLKLLRKMGSEAKDQQEFVLVADKDVRLRSAADATSGSDERCTVAVHDDAVLQRLLASDSARAPIVVEIAEDHPAWVAAAGRHGVLGPKRQASRPVFYVRKGVLPPTDKDKEPPTWTATWSTAAPEAAELPQHNVMGLLRGTTKKDEYVIVSAHYDHIGTGRAVGGDAINNGADDNATGTTGVLLLAEALTKLPAPKRSILFVCFTGEERGLLGSRAFCARPPVPLDKVAVVLNLEMLGRPEPGKQGKAWFTGVDFSDLGAIAAPVLQRGGVEVVEFPMAKQLFQQSDNYPFALAGVVAHSLSAGSLHQDYHQPSDEVEKLDVPHMTTVIRGLLELVTDLANRDAAPQWNDKGRSYLERRRPKKADKPASEAGKGETKPSDRPAGEPK